MAAKQQSEKPQKTNQKRKKAAYLGGFSKENGRSVIIGLGKIQSYQWFASRWQEVFILNYLIQNSNPYNHITQMV